MSDDGIALALTLLATLMVGAAVHIVSLLIVPYVAPDDAYARVAGFAPEGTLRALPRASSPGDPLPARDPAVASGLCRYDLGGGPLRVSVGLGDDAFVAVSLHSRSGVAFYALDDRSADDGRLDLVVMTPDQLAAAALADTRDQPVRDVRVVAPERQGFVGFDVLPRIGGYDQAQRALASMGCRVEHPQ